MSLLTICQGAAIKLSQPAVNTVIGSGVRFHQELQALAMETGLELLRRHDWGGLVRTASYASLPASLPADFERLTQGSPVRLGSTPIRGALSDAEMALKRAAPSSSPPRFMLRRPTIDVAPAPSGEVTVEYITANWIMSADVTPQPKPTFTANSDTSLIPEDILGQGIVWRWRRLKGHEYQDELDQYEQAVQYYATADRAMRLPAEVPTSTSRPAKVTA